jgi:4-amino-4-deoxy-L-arabinose transferase-like glycosyltransferase
VKLKWLAFPDRVGWRDHIVGAGMALAYVAWLLMTARSLGFPRDEGVYFSAASSYIGWWRLLLDQPHVALTPGVIDSAWTVNAEHPALMKTLFGLSWWLLHERWHVFADASTAYRLPAMCVAGMSIWTTYLFGARAWTRRSGLAAAALLGSMPRVFFHAHLACFDVPIMAMWLMCVYVQWRALERGGVGWTIASGVVFGLALETKHNAWMLPAVLVPHVILVAWTQRRSLPRGLRLGRVPIPWTLVSMAILGPLVFYGLWPRLWTNLRGHLEWYINFHLNHEYYNIEFLGRNYFGPPSPKSYLPIMVIATVPTIALVLFGIGAVDRGAAMFARFATLRALPGAMGKGPATGDGTGRDERAQSQGIETDLLLALSLLVAVGPFFLAKTPIFGGTKHWLPAYPALALFAGRGFELVLTAMRRALPSLGGAAWLAAKTGLLASVTIAPIAETAHSHPFGLSAYVPVVGGTAGGADLGLNRQFWGFTTESAASEYLNPFAPGGATVFIHDTTWDAFRRMQEEKRIRGDLRAVGAPGEAQLALVQHELHMNEVDYSIWVAFGTDAPVYVVTHDGVPIVSIYKRR